MEDFSQEIIDQNPENFVRRRKLLPIWVKIPLWLFFLFGVVGVFILLFGWLFSFLTVTIYGLQSVQPYSAIGLFIIGLFILKGLVSFGLWFEKDWGPKLAVYDGVLGALICLFVMFILPYLESSGIFSIRLELLILVPYIIKMINIQEPWARKSEK